MFRKKFLVALFVTYSLTELGGAYGADLPLHIDIPVKLEKANVVFDAGHVVSAPGDMPFLLGDLNLLASDLKKWGVNVKIVAIFHGDAAYLVLNDKAYMADRRMLGDDRYNAGAHAKAGNPYAELIAGLINQGVQIELCGATAKANHWGNADLIPGVKVNTNAMVRVTELEQKGFTLIYE